MKINKWGGNPVLKAEPLNDWEKVGVLNPGVIYDNGVVYMLYRASGEFDIYRIYLGLAVSKDGYNFERVSKTPVFSPSLKDTDFDGGCVEDPRIVKFGDYFYVTYASRPFPIGPKFWEKDPRLNLPKDIPSAWKNNYTVTGLLKSKDLRAFERLGPITSLELDNRDVTLFPEKINGKYVMMHRARQWVGREYGCDVPSIWLAFSDDMLHWTDDCLLMKPEQDWESLKIGAGAPPIKTGSGWLIIYHGVDKNEVYRGGAALLDLNDPGKVIARSPYFIIEPEMEFEKKGFVSNVVFPTGTAILGDTLFIYYGGADIYCCVATVKLKELVDYTMQFIV